MHYLTNYKLLGILFICAILGFSCAKRKKATLTAQDNEKAESMFSDVFKQSSNKTRNEEDHRFKKGKYNATDYIQGSGCANVEVTLSSDSTYFSEVVIDYGDGCEQNGRTREGKLFITMDNGRFFEEGTQITIETGDNFHIDDHKVEGTKAVTNLGSKNLNNGISFVFKIEVMDGLITTPDNKEISWESSRTHVWEFIQDDGLYIKAVGSANGVNSEGSEYSINILDSLVAKSGCGHLKEGELKIATEAIDDDVFVDYGDGTCDNKATMTIGKDDTEREINL
jgi:hypothetical protein